MKQKTTKNPEFIDNLDVLEGNELLKDLQAEQKIITRKYNMVRAGIKDTEDSNDIFLKECEKDYLNSNEFNKYFKEFYYPAQVLYQACTKKQKRILYLLFVKKYKISIIAEQLDIVHNSVITHMNLIKIKADKLNLKLNITGE